MHNPITSEGSVVDKIEHGEVHASPRGRVLRGWRAGALGGACAVVAAALAAAPVALSAARERDILDEPDPKAAEESGRERAAAPDAADDTGGRVETPVLSALAKMPVREVTVFKDGHAFVRHEGRMPVDENGDVVMDYLPAPVLGTFWPASMEQGARLTSVTAGQRKVKVERTALNLRDLIEANVGAEVEVTEFPLAAGEQAEAVRYRATIRGVPEQSGQEREATSPPGAGPQLPVPGEVVLLDVAGEGGVKVVSFSRIADIEFLGDEYATQIAREEFRNLLTLHLDWADGRAGNEADVGMMYLQRGIRWIPHYKVTLDGDGNAVVLLQATLLNEMTDLEDVTAHLVVGVPSFYFKETVDPIALQESIAQLSPYFQQAGPEQYLSNAMMTQAPRMTEVHHRGRGEGGEPGDLGPEVAGSEKSEDLFVFSVDHVTLKKGQRMVIPVAELKMKYEDVYTLDVPFSPPPEIWQQFGSDQQAEIARLLNAPKVMHKIRLSNDNKLPLTTAPALILKEDRVLAQGMMTYTAPGAKTDLEVTAAVDTRVKKEEKEVGRVPNAARWQGEDFGRIDLQGEITLSHFGDKPIRVEVRRHVLGNVTEADHDGEVARVNVFEDAGYAAVGRHPHWWGWYSWPYWWHHFNGVGKVTWDVELKPGEEVTLTYTWNYYWR